MNRHCRSVAVIVFVCAAIVAPLTLAADDPTLPEEVLGLVEIASPTTLEQHARAYVTSIAPEQAGQIPPFSLGLMRVAKTAQPTLIDMSKPFRIVWVKNGQSQPTPVFVFHVTDAEQYSGSLLPNLTRNEEKDGVTFYTERGMMGEESQVAIAAVGNHVCVGTDPACVTVVLGLMKAGKFGSAPLLGAEGDAHAFTRPRATLEHLTTVTGNSPFNALRSQIMANQQDAGMPQGTLNMLMFMVDGLESLVRQMESAHARLDIDQDRAQIGAGIKAVEGSALAAYLETVPSGLPERLKYIPEDAFLIFAGKFGDQRLLTDWATRFMQQAMAGQGAEQAKMEEVATLMARSADLMGSEIVYGIRPSSSLSGIEVIQLKDAESGKKLMETIVALTERMQEYNAAFGAESKMTFELAAEPYRGHEITRWNLDMKLPTEGVDPAVAMMQNRMMDMIFGAEGGMYSTVDGDSFIITFGEEGEKTLKGLLDGSTKPIIMSSQFQFEVMKNTPKTAEGLFYVRLGDYMEWTFGLMQTLGGGQMPMLWANMEFPEGPGIRGYMDVDGRDAQVNLTVPAAEIKSLVDGFQAAVQQMMMEQMGPGPMPQ